MESTSNATAVAELQLNAQQTLHISEVDQATTNTVPFDEVPSILGNTQEPSLSFPVANINNFDSSGPMLKLAGAGMTKFHKYMDMPLELRARIMEVNMFEDKVVTAPRVINIYMEWNPEEDECFGNHGQSPEQPGMGKRVVYANEIGDEDQHEDEDGDRNQEADGDAGPHMHVYPDHDNFAWKIEDDSKIRRSHRPLIPYFTVSKECKQIVEKFLVHQMGRRKRAFWSPDLRKLPLSSSRDVFYIDCPAAWEAVNEWGSASLRASHDALLMRRFMVDFTTFHGLVMPALRNKDQFLLDISSVEPCGHFRGESSMAAVLRNAAYVFVLSDADKELVTKAKNIIIWHENFQVEGVPDDGDMPAKAQEVLQSVWREENIEFNGLRDRDGSLPAVFWATAPK